MLSPLPDDFDLGFLEGRELIQVSIGLYQVIFSFFQNLTISIEDRFVFDGPSGRATWQQGETQAAAQTVALLGGRITRVLRRSSTIELQFDNSCSLSITPTDAPYESFQITHEGRTIVV